jgi:hypothetical protein
MKLRIGPPNGDRSSRRSTGLVTRTKAFGGWADSTGALCVVTMSAYATIRVFP